MFYLKNNTSKKERIIIRRNNSIKEEEEQEEEKQKKEQEKNEMDEKEEQEKNEMERMDEKEETERMDEKEETERMDEMDDIDEKNIQMNNNISIIENFEFKKEDIIIFENLYLFGNKETVNIENFEKWMREDQTKDKKLAKANCIFIQLRNDTELIMSYTFNENQEIEELIEEVIKRFKEGKDKKGYFTLRKCCSCDLVYPFMKVCLREQTISKDTNNTSDSDDRDDNEKKKEEEKEKKEKREKEGKKKEEEDDDDDKKKESIKQCKTRYCSESCFERHILEEH